jgi:hypothetical protein
MGTLLGRLLEPGLRQRTRGKLRRDSWPDAALACETLEARTVMSAAPVVVGDTVLDNPASDFTYQLWNGDIALNSYHGPGGEVRIPATIEGLAVTRILGPMFPNRGDVTAVVLPPTVSVISSYAFNGAGITSINLPASVVSVEQAFKGADRLQNIYVDPANPLFTSIDGVLFRTDKTSFTSLWEYPAGRAGAYTVPNGVTDIGHYAFAYSNKLTNVTLAPTVQWVSSEGFAYCTRLRTVSIPEGVGGLGQFSFRSCPELRQVSLPSTIESANYAFFDCPKLQILSGPATAPRNPQATLVAGNRVQLTWQSPKLAKEQAIDVRRYRVEYSVNGGKTWQAALAVSGKMTSVTLPTLYGRRTYVFRLTPIAGFPYAAPYNTNATVLGQSASTTITVPGRSLFRF